MQGEAIGALRGSEREMEIIIDEFAVHVADCHKHHWDFLTFHSLWNFFIIQGGEALGKYCTPAMRCVLSCPNGMVTA